MKISLKRLLSDFWKRKKPDLQEQTGLLIINYEMINYQEFYFEIP